MTLYITLLATIFLAKLANLKKLVVAKNKIADLVYSSVGNCQNNSLPNCHIWKTAKYNSHQIFSFYSVSFNFFYFIQVWRKSRENVNRRRRILKRVLVLKNYNSCKSHIVPLYIYASRLLEMLSFNKLVMPWRYCNTPLRLSVCPSHLVFAL